MGADPGGNLRRAGPGSRDPASGAADVEIHGWFTKVSERTVGGNFSLDRTVREMKERGILPKDNISVPSKGIFQSDTGELTMRVREKLLKVVTPRTEAVAMLGGKSERLGAVSVLKNSTRGCLGVTSIDALPLPESRRMVIVYATEVVNSGMELGGGRARLVKPGTGPALLKTGEFALSIRNRNRGTWKFYALSLAGNGRKLSRWKSGTVHFFCPSTRRNSECQYAVLRAGSGALTLRRTFRLHPARRFGRGQRGSAPESGSGSSPGTSSGVAMIATLSARSAAPEMRLRSSSSASSASILAPRSIEVGRG